MKLNFIKNRKGTALLVALLVMGVLMAVSLALSTLIFRETRITKEFIDSGQAYYAAESAIEVGLYNLNNNLPGWGTEGYESLKIDDDFNAVAELKVQNKCQAYPCFDEGFDISTAELKEFYAVLGLNESITVPLFVVEDDEVRNVTDFVVEFYAPFSPQDDLNVNPNGWELSGWDVLRWKIMGITNQNPAKPVTETVSDFTAVSMQNIGGEQYSSNTTGPSWFGSIDCDTVDGNSRYTDQIICEPYYVNAPSGKQIAFDPEDLGQVSKIYAGTCSQMEAREYYKYDYTGDEKKVASINGCYSIKTFLQDHDFNYLTLTNLVNPSVFKEKKNEALTKIYFRVELFTDSGGSISSAETVREYADLTANGYSGKTKQSINVKLKRNSFMPVFNFSLYSTYMTGKEENDGNVHDDEYWYGSKEDTHILPY